jgi:hypothetical protein
MKRQTLFMVCLVLVQILVIGVGASHAEVSTFTYDVPEPVLRTVEDGVYYGIEGFGSSTNPYYPVLPTKRVNFEIPFAATGVQVTVLPGARQSLGVLSD